MDYHEGMKKGRRNSGNRKGRTISDPTLIFVNGIWLYFLAFFLNPKILIRPEVRRSTVAGSGMGVILLNLFQ
jgi:hypothetical protein